MSDTHPTIFNWLITNISINGVVDVKPIYNGVKNENLLLVYVDGSSTDVLRCNWFVPYHL